jgi:hypothetical protein
MGRSRESERSECERQRLLPQHVFLLSEVIGTVTGPLTVADAWQPVPRPPNCNELANRSHELADAG